MMNLAMIPKASISQRCNALNTTSSRAGGIKVCEIHHKQREWVLAIIHYEEVVSKVYTVEFDKGPL